MKNIFAEIWQQQEQRIKFLEGQVRFAESVIDEISDDQLENIVDRLVAVDTVEEIRARLQYTKER